VGWRVGVRRGATDAGNPDGDPTCAAAARAAHWEYGVVSEFDAAAARFRVQFDSGAARSGEALAPPDTDWVQPGAAELGRAMRREVARGLPVATRERSMRQDIADGVAALARSAYGAAPPVLLQGCAADALARALAELLHSATPGPGLAGVSASDIPADLAAARTPEALAAALRTLTGEADAEPGPPARASAKLGRRRAKAGAEQPRRATDARAASGARGAPGAFTPRGIPLGVSIPGAPRAVLLSYDSASRTGSRAAGAAPAPARPRPGAASRGSGAGPGAPPGRRGKPGSAPPGQRPGSRKPGLYALRRASAGAQGAAQGPARPARPLARCAGAEPAAPAGTAAGSAPAGVGPQALTCPPQQPGSGPACAAPSPATGAVAPPARAAGKAPAELRAETGANAPPCARAALEAAVRARDAYCRACSEADAEVSLAAIADAAAAIVAPAAAALGRCTAGALRGALAALGLAAPPAYAPPAPAPPDAAAPTGAGTAAALAAALAEAPDALDARLPNTVAGAAARRREEALQLLLRLEIHRVLAAGARGLLRMPA